MVPLTPTPITSFTSFVVPGPGSTAAQILPGRLFLGAHIYLAYEPQQLLAILGWAIEAKVFEVETLGLRILRVSHFYVFVLSHDK